MGPWGSGFIAKSTLQIAILWVQDLDWGSSVGLEGGGVR